MSPRIGQKKRSLSRSPRERPERIERTPERTPEKERTDHYDTDPEDKYSPDKGMGFTNTSRSEASSESDKFIVRKKIVIDEVMQAVTEESDTEKTTDGNESKMSTEKKAIRALETMLYV